MYEHIHSGHWHKHKRKVIENDEGKCCFCKLEMTSPCEDMENFIRQLQVDLVGHSSSEVVYNSIAVGESMFQCKHKCTSIC